MPGYDRSGPIGRGPRTGRGLGLCGGAQPAYGGWDYTGFGLGRGGRPWGGGRGRGAGGWYGRGRGLRGPAFRGGYPGGAYPLGANPGGPFPSETDALQAEAENLKFRLKEVEDRLADLERSDPTE